MQFDQPELNRLVADMTFAAKNIKKAAKEVLEEVSDDVAETAKSFAPIAGGELRDSITSEVTEGTGGVTAEAGPEVYYGRFVEYGTSKMAPQAFMGPALDRHIPDLENKLGEAGEF